MRWTSFLFPTLGLLALCLGAFGCDSGASGQPADGDDMPCLCASGCDADGNCLAECESGEDCPPGYICNEGTCEDSRKTPDGDASDGDGNFPDGDDTRDPSKPWIQVDPLYLDFGAAALGQRMERQVIVSNQGGEDLVVDGAYLKMDGREDQPELSLPALSLPLVIAPREEASITIAFVPLDQEPDLDWLVIESNDPVEPEVEVEIITGVKAYGNLRVSPEAIDFGLVRMGSHTRQVSIANRGGLDIQLVGLAITQGGQEFGIPSAPPNITEPQPYTLGPNQTLVVDVVYTPLAPDGLADTGTLTIRYRDETSAPADITIPLTASCCEPEIDALPSVLDFSSVHLGANAVRCLRVFNRGCMDLLLESLTIIEDADGAFSWETRVSDGTSLGEGEDVELCIRFAPTEPDQENGILEIRNNDADEAVLHIPLSSEVVPPDIDCEPRTLNFGDVLFGETPALSVTCRNTSTAALHISQTSIAPANSPFQITAMPDTTLFFEQETEIEVTYSPTTAGNHQATLSVASNDPDENPFPVALRGKGVDPNRCPVAAIEILSPTPPDIYQFNTVELNGGISHDPDDGDTINAYVWTLVRKPAGSVAQVHTQGAAQVRVYLDMLGVYEVRLDVRDSKGLQNCEPAFVEFEALARPPAISCTPAFIDYGVVPVGSSDTRAVTCRNTGYAPLEISHYQIVTPAAGVFSIANTPSTVLQFSESTFVELRYAPLAEGDNLGALRVYSNDPDNPMVEVTLRGGSLIPNTCPVAVARITSPTGPIEQFNTVQLDASGSYDSDLGDSIGWYGWTLEQKPGGSTTTIHPAFGSPQPSLYVDQPGFYRIRLDVKDQQDLASCAPAYLEFTAAAPPPVILCSPLVVNYGVVPIGGSVTEVVQCRNTGNGLLRVSSYQLQQGSPAVFALINSPLMDITPGSSTELHIRYSPGSVAAHSGTMRVHSNDPATPTVSIALMANSYDPNTCPVAAIRTTSPDLSRLKPLDTVLLDGRTSSDPDPGDSIAEYIWAVESRPSGSTSQIQNPSSATPSFFVDLAGIYRIRLQVRDTRGMLSCQPAYLELNAIPREIIHVQLTWNTNEGDMDLHLVRPGGSLWSSGDCYFSNKTPNWGTFGRPRLDIDRQRGYGPENINLNDPGTGTYKVYVHYWNTWGETRTVGVTVRIYIWGNLEKTYTYNWPRADRHKRWHVADIVWNGADANVADGATTLEADGHGQGS